jgi:hypothetical protein
VNLVGWGEFGAILREKFAGVKENFFTWQRSERQTKRLRDTTKTMEQQESCFSADKLSEILGAKSWKQKGGGARSFDLRR